MQGYPGFGVPGRTGLSASAACLSAQCSATNRDRLFHLLKGNVIEQAAVAGAERSRGPGRAEAVRGLASGQELVWVRAAFCASQSQRLLSS